MMRVTSEFGWSEEPEMIGVGSGVVEPGAGVVMSISGGWPGSLVCGGGFGVTFSGGVPGTTIVNAVSSVAVLPCSSLAVPMTWWVPPLRGEVGVCDQLPWASVGTSTGLPPSMVSLMAPLSTLEVPVMTGVWSSVCDPSAGVVMVMAGGMSIAKSVVSVAVPAGVVTVAATVCGPSASGAVGV